MTSALAWVSILLLAMGWIAYPMGLKVVASLRSRRGSPAVSVPDSVGVVVATREEPSVVRRRVDDLRRSKIDAETFEVIVSVDCRAPYPIEDYRTAIGSGAVVVQGDEPGGKAVTLNAGVRACTAEIVVFADSHQTYHPSAISALVEAFADATVGAVSGTYSTQENPSWIDHWFWQYEILLRRLESQVHSVVAVTGAIYAIRRELWIPLADGVICDDLFVPANILFCGYRVISTPRAMAHDPRRFSPDHEIQRKVRTLTGLIQFCAWEPRALSPWSNPVFLQFVCHKLLRLITPFLVIGAVLGLAPPVVSVISRTPGLALAVAAAGAIAVAVARPAWVRRALREAKWLVLILAAPFKAFRNAALGDWDVWNSNRHR